MKYISLPEASMDNHSWVHPFNCGAENGIYGYRGSYSARNKARWFKINSSPGYLVQLSYKNEIFLTFKPNIA